MKESRFKLSRVEQVIFGQALRTWQEINAAGDAVDSIQRKRLDDILVHTHLSSQTLIDVGRSVDLQSRDTITVAQIYAAASYRADDELDHFESGSKEARPILIALNSTKPLLWRAVDGGHHEFVEALSLLNDNLIAYIDPADAQLNSMRIHGYIGSAECLYVTDNNLAAMTAAMSIDTVGLTDGDKAAVAWIRGLALFSNHRFTEAADQFRIVTATPTFKYNEAAFHRLILSLTSAGNDAEAKKAYDEWIARYHPNSKEAAFLMERIQATDSTQ